MLEDILTLGGNSRLNKEIREFEFLKKKCLDASELYKNLIEKRSFLFYDLMLERNEALRNFQLLKSLIKTYKKFESNKKNTNTEDELSVQVNINFNQTLTTYDYNHGQVLDNSIRNISQFTGKSFERLLNSIDVNGTITKQDVKAEAIMVGVDMVGEAFNYIGNLNEQISKKRKEVQSHISDLNASLREILDSYGNVYAESLRIDEIFQVLNKSNHNFVEKYKSIIQKYFNNYDLTKESSEFKGSKQEFERDLKMLITLCNGYSKIQKVNV